MMTIAQVSATFVAIIGGFYTAKILSIASDKQRIRAKIKEIIAERDELRKQLAIYQQWLENVYYEKAKKTIDRFSIKLLAEDELNEFSMIDLQVKFRELERREPSEYERKTLDDEYNNIIQKVKTEIEERRPKEPPNLGLSAASLAAFALPGSVSSHSRKQSYSLLSDTNPRRDKIEDEYESKRDVIQGRINVLDALEKQHQDELKSTALPRHITFGYLSQVAFAVLGVVLPLTYGSWAGYVGEQANIVGLVAFGAGLITIFTYIFIEVLAAVKSEHSSDTELPASKAQT